MNQADLDRLTKLSMNIVSNDFDNWYFAKTEDDIRFLVDVLKSQNPYASFSGFEQLKVGEPFAVHYELRWREFYNDRVFVAIPLSVFKTYVANLIKEREDVEALGDCLMSQM